MSGRGGGVIKKISAHSYSIFRSDDRPRQEMLTKLKNLKTLHYIINTIYNRVYYKLKTLCIYIFFRLKEIDKFRYFYKYIL